MSLLPHDPPARRALATGAFVALAILACAAAFDLPIAVSGLLPALWVVLQAPRRPDASRAGHCVAP